MKTKNALQDRITWWSSNAVIDGTGDIDDSVGIPAFQACGGYCTYIDNEYQLDVSQVYFPKSPPHIVFVLVDDWGWNDVGFRSTYMSWTTPTIDRLALEGVYLNNYFTQSFCVPTRGAFLTGRFAGRLGLLEDIGTEELPLSEVTIAQEMKSAGYRTYMIGKWDLGYV